MSLLKNITDEMYLSMKSGDKEKANTLRTLISKLKDQQIKLRKDKKYELFVLTFNLGGGDFGPGLL